MSVCEYVCSAIFPFQLFQAHVLRLLLDCSHVFMPTKCETMCRPAALIPLEPEVMFVDLLTVEFDLWSPPKSELYPEHKVESLL